MKSSMQMFSQMYVVQLQGILFLIEIFFDHFDFIMYIYLLSIGTEQWFNGEDTLPQMISLGKENKTKT